MSACYKEGASNHTFPSFLLDYYLVLIGLLWRKDSIYILSVLSIIILVLRKESMRHQNQNPNSVSPVIAAVVGAAVGAAAGTFLAKKENRDKILKTVDKARDKGMKLRDDVESTAEDLKHRAQRSANELKGDVEQVADVAKDKARSRNGMK